MSYGKNIKHKFGAKAVECDGMRFDSKIEGRYYQKLKLAQRSGELLFHLRQVPIHLPGSTKLVIDFVEFWKDGTVVFTDVKGVETECFKLKRRQVEELYPIKINIVKKA